MPRSTPIHLPDLVITVDTREPTGGGWEPHFTVPLIRQKLDTGDYGILGIPGVGIERKTGSDLCQSLLWERDRFERELQRSRALEFFRVIVECDAKDFLNGRYGGFKTKANPAALWESMTALSVRYNTAFLFASDPPTAAKMCQSLLTKWVRECWKVLESVRKATVVYSSSQIAS